MSLTVTAIYKFYFPYYNIAAIISAIKQKMSLLKTKAILAIDMGASHTRFAIIKNSKILFKKIIDTTEITKKENLSDQINLIQKEQKKFKLTNLAIAAAGPPSIDKKSIELTRHKFKITTKKLRDKIKIKKIILVNDLVAQAAGIEATTPKQKTPIIKKKPNNKYPKVIIGPGTGLGIAYLLPSGEIIPSSASRTPASIQDEEDYQIIIKEKNKTLTELVSGSGLENIKKHYIKKSTTKINKEDQNHEIFHCKTKNHPHKKAADFYIKHLARTCAINAYNVMAYGGIYLVGDLVANNKECFQTKEFIKQFHSIKHPINILDNIAIYIISDPDLSIKGLEKLSK
jgi:glucokinase